MSQLFLERFRVYMIVVFLRIAYLWCCSTMTEKLEEKLECSRLDSFSFESGSDA